MFVFFSCPKRSSIHGQILSKGIVYNTFLV
nr:MAG TPA: hypothetical protein [Caudoviricetes sp.]